MISICMYSTDRWVLHSDCQKPGKDTFNGGVGLVLFFEVLCAIFDLRSGTWFDLNFVKGEEMLPSQDTEMFGIRKAKFFKNNKV